MSGQIHHQTSPAQDDTDDKKEASSQLFLWMAYQTKERLCCKVEDVQAICVCNIPKIQERRLTSHNPKVSGGAVQHVIPPSP